MNAICFQKCNGNNDIKLLCKNQELVLQSEKDKHNYENNDNEQEFIEIYNKYE